MTSAGSPRKVTFVSTLDAGGPVTHLVGLIPPLVERGVEVTVVAADEATAARYREAGARALVVAVRSKWDVGAARRLRAALRGADVVHAQDRRAGQFARPLGRLAGARVVHTYHGLPEDVAVRAWGADRPALPWRRRAWLSGVYFPLESVLARLGPVVVPSEAMARALAGLGLPGGRLVVVPSAVEVLRSEAPPAHEPLRVATAANLEPWKGVDVVVRACAAVARSGRPVHLDVYGTGSEADALDRLARREGADATFHGEVGALPARLLDADLFALGSRAENLPMVILEAMGAALPVIATDVGGVAEAVVDGETGLLVPADDVGGMAEALDRLAADDGLRRRMGAAGARRAAGVFSPAAVADRLLALYARA